MKHFTSFIFPLLFFAQIANAQKSFKKALTGISRINIETQTSLHIVAAASNEIVINEGCTGCDSSSSFPAIKETSKMEEDDRAHGLQPIYPGGADNTGMGILIEQSGSGLRVRDLKSRTLRKGLTIYLPATMALILNGGDIGNLIIESWKAELEITTGSGAITLKKITGPITAHSTTGTIEVDFTALSQEAPSTITSSSGIIDISLPAPTKATVDLKSSTGTVYTGFNIIKKKEDGLKPLTGNSIITGDINSGGVRISLRSSTGNIYLRKSTTTSK